MSFFGKKFKFHNSENHDDFLNTLGLSTEKKGFFMNFTPDQKIEISGDNYVYIFDTPRGEKLVPFTSGVEFEDKAGDMSVKNTFTVEGNKVTHVMKFDSNITITASKEFSAMKLIEKLTHSNWDGVATITYNV